MRFVLGTILVATVVVSHSAYGQPIVAAAQSDAPAIAWSAPGVDSGFRLAPDLTAESNSGPFGFPLDRLQARAETAMLDFFPGETAGFHFSAGLRLFRRANFWRDAQKATDGLLTIPRSLANAGGHVGVKRYAPSMTWGYTLNLSHSLAFDVEGGAMLGSSVAGSPLRFGDPHSSGNDNEGMRISPVVHFSLGYKF